MRLTLLTLRRKGHSELAADKLLNDTANDAISSGCSVCRIFKASTDNRGRYRCKLVEVRVK